MAEKSAGQFGAATGEKVERQPTNAEVKVVSQIGRMIICNEVRAVLEEEERIIAVTLEQYTIALKAEELRERERENRKRFFDDIASYLNQYLVIFFLMAIAFAVGVLATINSGYTECTNHTCESLRFTGR